MRSAASRLAAFVLVLLGTFGTAYAVGERLPGHEHTDTSLDAGHSGNHGGDEGDGHLHGPLTPNPPATAADGYQLVAAAMSTSGETAFALRGPDSKPVTAFTEAHGALIHTVLIRADLTGFQHVHPTIADDGTFVVKPNGPGPWRVIFETQPASADAPIVVATDIDDGSVPSETPLPEPQDELQLEVQGDTVTVRRDGPHFSVDAPAPLEPYLGQQAHLIAIRQGDLAYTHLHPGDPMEGMLMFSSTISEPGTYRMFLQFGYRGDVVTAPFTVVVP